MQTGLEIKQINLSDTLIQEGVSRLCAEFSGEKQAGEAIYKSTNTQSPFSAGSLYLGAFENNKLVGFQAYISHDLIHKGKIHNCYQLSHNIYSSDRSAVLNDLFAVAGEILNARGAGLIFTWQSVPGFNSDQMKFREIGSFIKARIPASGFLLPFHLNKWNEKKVFSTENSISQNDTQLIKLKKQIYGSDKVISYSDFENLIWGKLEENNSKNTLKLGGMIVSNRCLLPKTFKSFFKTFKFDFVEIEVQEHSDFKDQFRNIDHVNNSLFVHELNLTSESPFNFFGGIRHSY